MSKKVKTVAQEEQPEAIKETTMRFPEYLTPKRVQFTMNAMSKVNASRKERCQQAKRVQELKEFLK